ncbi:MAG: hypothetical protein WDN45_05850 [Caulobacteraceae bacterium]
MPTAFPFFLFAGPAEHALRWIRIDKGPPSLDPSLPNRDWAGAQRRIAESLPPHLRRDVLRDE